MGKLKESGGWGGVIRSSCAHLGQVARGRDEMGCGVSDHLSSACSRRAPVLVALALIESGMKYEDAIQFIRQ